VKIRSKLGDHFRIATTARNNFKKIKLKKLKKKKKKRNDSKQHQLIFDLAFFVYLSRSRMKYCCHQSLSFMKSSTAHFHSYSFPPELLLKPQVHM
jgi:hypothetical protein